MALAVVLYGLCYLLDANPYLAAFTAGSVLATLDPQASREFDHTGSLVSELAKDGALLAFAALVTPELLGKPGVGGWVLAALTLVLARPAAIMLSLARSDLPLDQRAAAAWFGPKGFASVVYALIVLESGMPYGQTVFALSAVTVLVSIAVHSSTDVPIAHVLTRRSGAEAGGGVDPGPSGDGEQLVADIAVQSSDRTAAQVVGSTS